MSPAPETPPGIRTGSRERDAAFRSSFLRTLAVQGSWNYRSMLGSGFAYALLPILRRVYRDDPDGLRAALQRHVEHFNAHPYLAGMAVGAVGRLEKEGADPEMIRRFKLALKGPLGSLGDRLVWATWLPLSSLAGLVTALVAGWGGRGPGWGWGPLAFLLIYNAGHLTLRLWAFRVGVREGRGLGAKIRQSALTRWAEALSPVLTLLLGLVLGLILGAGVAGGLVPWPWMVPGAILFAVGFQASERSWNLSILGLVTLLAGLFAAGGAGWLPG